MAGTLSIDSVSRKWVMEEYSGMVLVFLDCSGVVMVEVAMDY